HLLSIDNAFTLRPLVVTGLLKPTSSGEIVVDLYQDQLVRDLQAYTALTGDAHFARAYEVVDDAGTVVAFGVSAYGVGAGLRGVYVVGVALKNTALRRQALEYLKVCAAVGAVACTTGAGL